MKWWNLYQFTLGHFDGSGLDFAGPRSGISLHEISQILSTFMPPKPGCQYIYLEMSMSALITSQNMERFTIISAFQVFHNDELAG